MDHMDGRKDPNNPVLFDTRQVEYYAMLGAIQGYLNGAVRCDQLRALHIEFWSTSHRQKEFGGDHPLFAILDEMDSLYANFLFEELKYSESDYRRDLHELTGLGVITGTISNLVNVDFHVAMES